jgi:hypothetical protein
VVATLGLGWHIYTWTRQHRTRVRVTLTFGFPVGPEGAGPSMLMVTVYNDSSHVIFVQGVGFALEDGTKRTAPIIDPPPVADLPGAIAPRDHGQTWTELDDFRILLGPIAVRGYADTRDGKRHLSKPQKL